LYHFQSGVGEFTAAIQGSPGTFLGLRLSLDNSDAVNDRYL
jgi:hypothetical protein